MASALLEAVEIGRQSDDGTWLLRAVSLRVNAGDRWAVTGPTGAGKTVFLRSLARLDRIDAGRILWKGEEVLREAIPEFRRDIVYLHQRPVLVEGTVETNLRLPFSLKAHYDRTFDREFLLEQLAVLARDASFLDKRERDLSGGERQITALLRAIQLEPSVLLLDEPTSALDADSVRAVETLVDRWLGERETERAVVWVGHDAGQIGRVADRELSLQSGRLVRISEFDGSASAGG